jgi:hypothetical protein
MSQMSRYADTALLGLYVFTSQLKRSSGTFTRACVIQQQQPQQRQHFQSGKQCLQSAS